MTYADDTLVSDTEMPRVAVFALADNGIQTVGQLRAAYDANGRAGLLRYQIQPRSVAPLPVKMPPRICEIPILNADSEAAWKVIHARAGYIRVMNVSEAGAETEALDLDYEEARSIAWALLALCDTHEAD